MKFLRVGSLGNEKPASLDKNGKLRDLSNYISDFNSDTINFETLNKLRNLDLETLPEINQETRIGACIKKPGNFFAIGLNL